MGIVHIFYPITEGFVNGIFQGPATLFYRYHSRTQAFHPKDVRTLPCHIHFTHINGAVKTKFGGHGGCCHAMLTRSGFGNDPFFAHAFGEQALAHHIVCLMGTRMIQVFAFDIDTRTAK